MPSNNMTIPPFPSQDLAKLVLGYLAEEQLMTAYDEFLQASPYLDALGNEYDRIFMTSLKNILAEYRAVKIYVETCKPFVLRKKLFQCSNLLEMVKMLIHYVDYNKLQALESNQSKHSLEKQSSQTSLKANYNCDVCSSLKLDMCVCKSRNYSTASTPLNTHISMSSTENSVETTPLSDLPGNHVTCRKKNARGPNKEFSEVKSAVEQSEIIAKLPSSNEPSDKGLTSHSTANLSQKPDSLESQQKDEFYSILNKVCNKREQGDKNLVARLDNIDPKRVSMGGYNDFATGVKSGGSSIIVPDSSTSENLQVQIPATKGAETTINLEKSTKVTKRQTRTQYLLKVAKNVPNPPNDIVSICTMNDSTLPKIKPKKSEQSKIKILSDIKVDKSFNNTEGPNMAVKPPILRNATSTPLMQMHSIVINGTPVYKHTALSEKHNFTKDEIMAMPTIIVAPAPDPSRISLIGQSIGSDANLHIPASVSQAAKSHIVDVTSNNCLHVGKSSNVIDPTSKERILLPMGEPIEVPENEEATHPKPVDITSASAPKDITAVGSTDTSTPQVLPPLRKSSSTPRRTSHVRVLDFTTPRRILHETINECVPGMLADSAKEVILSRSPNLSVPITLEVVSDSNQSVQPVETSGLSKEKKVKNQLLNRTNWDTHLRILATVPEKNVSIDLTSSPKKKSEPKSSRKTKLKSQTTGKSNKTLEEKPAKKKRTPKAKLPKNKILKEEDEEIITIPDDKVVKPVKPTIKIIAGEHADLIPPKSAEVNKSQNKSNNEENIVDTPEMERMSLQNEIGAKLNISDLLETPYKQALYDIQMETPRFLGPDIPDDPMSDIKIMNIPTPRFLNAAATPSSYSSRPTDYSSGGSYYKPDDQDYMRVHDDLDCPVSSTKEAGTSESNKDSDDSKEKENMKPTRPVRECTKNISYYNLANMKARSSDGKEDMDSSVDSTAEEPVENSNPVTPRNKDIKVKTDKKGSIKKRKSPIKKENSKTFMKIKPRRPTPTKNTVRGRRKLSDPANQSKVQTRKKRASKERNDSATPIVNSVPTKSRRKSSTPRKLQCSKPFNSESSGHESPEFVAKVEDKLRDPSQIHVQDSDTEQLPLRWSDDGSQDPQPVLIRIPNDSEDIKKIREYIETTVESKLPGKKEEVSLHIDLVKRGFDLETAKIIERDLLDTPPHIRQDSEGQENINPSTSAENKKNVEESKTESLVFEKTLESDCSTSNNLQIVQNDDEDDDEIELSIHDCNEDSANYITCSYDETKETFNKELTKLKDKFSMEVCIDDGVSIRLRATPFSLLHDLDPQEEFLNYSYRETEMAVNSISNFEKLYTPLKESLKAQCFEIFDSTLTSLDTPLKVRSPKKEISVTQIVLEVEPVEEKEKPEIKKRKRIQSGNLSDESASESKKPKPEAQILFNSANIQNIDIESVLSKLHGP